MKLLNGQSFKKLLKSGTNELYNHLEEIDALNVFPVPDGDTGTNMNLTLTSGCKEIENDQDTNLYNIAKKFSHGLLMGARGNSGVITSQIFRGIAEGLEGKKEVNVLEFVDALNNGVDVVYNAVVKPVEGTILTVYREAVGTLKNAVRSTFSFERCFEIFLKEARESLRRTPNLLPILKEAGVVDSGGAGLIKIFEGMNVAINGKIIKRVKKFETDKPLVAAGASIEEDEFGYCTEFIMELGPDSVKKEFDQKSFTSELENKGNSLVVVRDENIVKVHVHTLEPGDVLNYAQQFGEFLKLKIENMTEQHHALMSGKEVNKNEDLVGEPEENLPHTKNAIISVSCGKGIDALFNELGVKLLVKGGQTMNPSSENFVSAIKKANADNIFILPNNSNIVMAAEQAKKICKDIANVYVIPSKTILQGVSCAAMFNMDGDPKENYECLKDAIAGVKSGEITSATRNATLKGVSIKKDDFIGIFDKDIVLDCSSKVKAATDLIDKMVDVENNSIITLLVGQGVKESEKQEVLNYIDEKYPDFDVDVRDGDQPVYPFLIGVE